MEARPIEVRESRNIDTRAAILKRDTNETWRHMAKENSKSSVPASEFISEYIAKHKDWRGEALAKIRMVFHEADSEIVEEWKWMGSPVWSRHGQIAVANAHRDKVKLTFSQGAHLPDPHKIFNAGLGGSQWRAIDIFKDGEINASALKALIRSAIRYNDSKRK